jgi:hypothetical protein
MGKLRHLTKDDDVVLWGDQMTLRKITPQWV